MAHKWADSGYMTLSSVGPDILERGTKSAVAHQWADWLYKPIICQLCQPPHETPPSWGPKPPRAGRIAPRVGLKTPNMQEHDHPPPYTTSFTQVPLPFTRGSKELPHAVFRQCLPNVDTVCHTRSATVDTTGML